MTVNINGTINYSARVGESEEPWTLPVIWVEAGLNDSLYTEAQLDAAAAAFIQTLGGSTVLSDGHKSYPNATVVDEWSV